MESTNVNKGIINIRKADAAGTIRWEKRIRGVFKEIFELEKFPYDVQTLLVRIRLNSHRDNKIMKRFFTVGDENDEESGPTMKPTVFVPEWRLYKPFHKCAHDDKGKPVYDVYMIINRRHGYFTNNVLVMMGSMCTLCLGAFAIDRKEYADRCSVVLTLLLTAVAFKFVVSDSMPKIPYLTVLDTYMNTAVGFLLIVFVQQTVTGLLDGSHGDAADVVCFYVSVIGWLIINSLFIANIVKYLRTVDSLLGEEINVKNALKTAFVVAAQEVALGPLMRYRKAE